MRVTFVIPEPNLAGGTRMIAQHADNLRRRGHSVTLVSTPPWDLALKTKLGVLARGGGWPKARKRLPSHLDGLGLEHRVLNRRRPVVDADLPDADVVIATWWETAPGVARLSPSKGAKTYFVQHYEAELGQDAAGVDATLRLPLQKVVVAKWLADLARDQFDDPDALVAPNGLDVARFDAPVRGRQPRPTVGMSYSDNPSKGWATGLRAYRLAAERVPGLRLVAFGTSRPKPGDLPEDAEFILDPPQDHIRDIYAATDVYLATSLSEGYCLPPVEAMGCRCPAVSTRVGGLPEVIQHGLNGYLVDPEDAEGLADGVVRVLDRPEAAWKAMSDSAYARAREITSEDATDVFEQALFTAVERQRGARPTPAHPSASTAAGK